MNHTGCSVSGRAFSIKGQMYEAKYYTVRAEKVLPLMSAFCRLENNETGICGVGRTMENNCTLLITSVQPALIP